MRIGVLGGTFDPIHNAHLFVAEDAYAQFRLDQVLIVPNAVPPHWKPYSVTPSEHRLRMAQLAVGTSVRMKVDPIEVERGGPSYTVITLRELHERYPGAEILFLTGADAVAEIGTWREPEEVVRLCRLIAVSRPGSDLDALRDRIPEHLRPFIETHAAPELGISSTLIRARVRQGLPVHYLTPEAVVAYIEETGLYRG